MARSGLKVFSFSHSTRTLDEFAAFERRSGS